MIEYLYDAIRASAGEEVTISAKITDDSGECISEVCNLRLYNDKTMLGLVPGVFNEEEEMWDFTLPGEYTEGLTGRYFYCICHHGKTISFKQPIYLV